MNSTFGPGGPILKGLLWTGTTTCRAQITRDRSVHGGGAGEALPITCLVLEERHSAADEDGRHPAAAVDTFLEEDAGGDGVGDEGERSGSGRDQAYICVT